MNSIASNIWKNRYLLGVWTKFNIQSKYIDTRLGLIWMVLQPITTTAVYTIVFSTLLSRPPRGNVPFIIFFLCGTTVWQFIQTSIMQAPKIIVGNIGLLSQIHIPSEIVLVVHFLEEIVDFVITLLIVFITVLIFGYTINSAYLYLPIIMISILSTSLGAIFFFGTLGVFVRDIPNVISPVMRLIFYFSGVIFSTDLLPENIAPYLRINPFLLMIESFRNILLYAEIPSFIDIFYPLAFGILSLYIGIRFFNSRNGVFVDTQ